MYRVESLLADRRGSNGREFLVRWQGYGPEEDTWEQVGNILDTNLILLFDRARRPAAVKRRQNAPQNASRGGGAGGSASGSTNGSSDSSARAEAVVVHHTAAWLQMSHASPPEKRQRVWRECCVDPEGLAEPLQWVEQPSSGAGPPLCRCGRAAVRRVGRWWCAAADWGEGGDAADGAITADAAIASGEEPVEGCGFELAQRRGQVRVPLCTCGRVATFLRGRYLCDAGVCHFDHKPDPPRVGEILLTSSALSLEAAKDTAALLTASAFGPMSAWAFVAPTDCGLGLHARVALQAGQFICEYGGPRILLRHQKTGSYVLEVCER